MVVLDQYHNNYLDLIHKNLHMLSVIFLIAWWFYFFWANSVRASWQPHSNLLKNKREKNQEQNRKKMKTKQIFKGTFKLRLLGLTSQSDLSETNNNTKNRKENCTHRFIVVHPQCESYVHFQPLQFSLWSNRENTKQSCLNLTTLVPKTAPLIPTNIKYELGLTNYKCKIPKMSLTKTPLQINLGLGYGVYHPPSNPHVDLTA